MKNPIYKFCYRTLLPLLCAACITPQAWAEIECEVMHANAELTILSPIGPVVGTAYFVIDGEPSVAAVTVNFLAPPEVLPDGTQRTLAKLDYDFGGGDTIIGAAVGVVTPTTTPGVFSNDQQVTYIAGTGKYENVVSRIIATGTLNFLDNTATQQGVGDLCVSEIDFNDDDYSDDED